MEELNDSAIVHSATERMKARIANTALQLIEISPSQEVMDAMSSSFFELAKEQVEISARVFHETMPAFLATLEQMMQILVETYQIDKAVEIPNDALEAFHRLSSLIPEDRQKGSEEIVAPAQGEKVQRITFDRVCALLSLLCSLVQILLQICSPVSLEDNESKEILCKQNEIEQKQVELAEDEIELLREFFDYVKESEISLPEQADTFLEQPDTLEDDIDAVGDSDLPDSQEDNADTQSGNRDPQP